MPRGDVETYHQNGEWLNKIEGEDQPFSRSGTKSAAVETGRDAAQTRKVEHIIKDENGRIAERNSYGHDPRNVRG